MKKQKAILVPNVRIAGGTDKLRFRKVGDAVKVGFKSNGFVLTVKRMPKSALGYKEGVREYEASAPHLSTTVSMGRDAKHAFVNYCKFLDKYAAGTAS